jgi:hypothetical protein
MRTRTYVIGSVYALLAASAAFACSVARDLGGNDVAVIPDGGAIATGDASAGDGPISDAPLADAAVVNCGPFPAPDAAAAQCSIAERAQRGAVMVAAPIVPAIGAGGLDLRGPHGTGLTFPEAEQTLCTSLTPLDIDSGWWKQGLPDGSVAMWGDNGENGQVVYVARPVDGGASARFLSMGRGYTGAVDFASPNHTHTYRAQIGAPVTRDGQLFPLDWRGPGPSWPAMDELYRALMATFAPGVPPESSTIQCTDIDSTHPKYRCVTGSFGVTAYMYFPEIGFAIWFPDNTAPQPAASTPDRIDVDAPASPCP